MTLIHGNQCGINGILGDRNHHPLVRVTGHGIEGLTDAITSPIGQENSVRIRLIPISFLDKFRNIVSYKLEPFIKKKRLYP
jgi:hypothetical protein